MDKPLADASTVFVDDPADCCCVGHRKDVCECFAAEKELHLVLVVVERSYNELQVSCLEQQITDFIILVQLLDRLVLRAARVDFNRRETSLSQIVYTFILHFADKVGLLGHW